MTDQAERYRRNRTWKAKLEFYLTNAESIVATPGWCCCWFCLWPRSARVISSTPLFPARIFSNRYLVLWVSFLGAVLAVRERHIKIDAVAVWFPESWRRKLERPIFVFCSVVCGFLFWAALRFWREEWAHVATAEKWVAGLGVIIPFSFFLLAAHYAIRFVIGPRSPDRAP